MTALAFWDDDVVLTGEGGLLRAYNIKTRRLLASAQLFRGQAIHGVITRSGNTSGGELLVHGGHDICRVRLVRQSTSSIDIEVGEVAKADDWILHAAFSPQALNNGGDFTAAIVTAHNALILVKPRHTNNRNDLRLSLEPVVSGSNCILYCAQVTWLSASHCLIASGTAFGDIVVWSCFLRQDGDALPASHQTHYAFPAHEGSVFGVELSTSDAAKAVGDYQHLLASCSDDRTIRLWDVSDLSLQAPEISDQQQETGFGAKSVEGYGPPLLAKVMGHVSRIWHVRFFHQQPEGEVYVLSFGEDAHCITWRLEAAKAEETNASQKLTQVNAERLHNGKNIWSLAVHNDSQIITGGADGALASFHFTDVKSLLSRQGEVSPYPQTITTGSNYRSYGFISQNSLIATDDQGQVHLLGLDNGSWQARIIFDCLPELRGYSAIASASGLAFVAVSQGSVYSCTEHASDLQPLLTTERKVAGLFVAGHYYDASAPCPRDLDLLITNVGSSIVLYCQHGEPATGEGKLSLPDGFVVTSFTTYHSGADEHIIVLGSRGGSIAVYRRYRQDELLSPSVVSTNVHSEETVTKLVLSEPPDNKPSNKLWLFSTGRDGTFAAHEIRLDDTDIALATRHQLQLPFGPNIEGCEVNAQGNIRVWGFRGKQFVVLDVTIQQEIMSIECGGVHRNWAFQSSEAGGTFVWTKASKLYFAHQEHLPNQTVNSGGHGREMKCIATSPVDPGLFATGAEDTDIKLNRCENGSFRCIHTLQKHVTGIQHLQWSSDGQYLFSSGGFEQFLVWRITTDIPQLDLGVICASRHPKSGTSDLRIMSFDVADQKAHDKDAMFRITMVYSDSTVRCWQYHDGTWILLAEGDYLTSCLTQYLHGADHERFITASTDGILTTWLTDNKQKKLKWKQRHKVHQSAILSTVQLSFAAVGTLILTGGDDNAIGITLVAESEPQTLFRTLLIPRAHAAAVTALAIVAVSEGHFWFVSASIDQRVKLWQVELDHRKKGSDMIDVKLVANVFTAVADVSSMEQIRCEDGQEGLLVAGVGLDVWKVPRLEDGSESG